jgi:hypothetical protein
MSSHLNLLRSPKRWLTGTTNLSNFTPHLWGVLLQTQALNLLLLLLKLSKVLIRHFQARSSQGPTSTTHKHQRNHRRRDVRLDSLPEHGELRPPYLQT